MRCYREEHMKKYKFISVLLALILVAINILGIGAFAKTPTKIQNESKYVYLSEEEVFEALAYTYQDQELQTAISSEKVVGPLGDAVDSFDSEAFSKFTNDEYGGMYIDNNGILVICFVDGSDKLTAATSNKNINSLQTLKNVNGETVVENYVFKAVPYSEQDLLDAYDFVNKLAAKEPAIRAVDVDIFGNRIVIGIQESKDIETINEKLETISGMYAFQILGKEYQANNVVTISGTSAINNKRISSTPAGKLYSYKYGQYGIITCAHGWSSNDIVYSGNTEIGKIHAWTYGGYADASFITLNNGHSYQDTHYDLFTSTVPVAGSTLTLRGYVSGVISGAKVLSINSSIYCDGLYCIGLIKCDKKVQPGDSGGGAYQKVIDGGRTASIIAINKAIDTSCTYLVKSKVIYEHFR